MAPRNDRSRPTHGSEPHLFRVSRGVSLTGDVSVRPRDGPLVVSLVFLPVKGHSLSRGRFGVHFPKDLSRVTDVYEDHRGSFSGGLKSPPVTLRTRCSGPQGGQDTFTRHAL